MVERASPARSRRRRLGGLGWALGTLGLAGCSVADNLTYPEIAGELDRIVEVRGEGAEQTIRYADRAEVSVWYMRNVLFLPFRLLLGYVAGSTSFVELENPSQHARELMLELPDEVGGDLSRGADAIARLLLVAELDDNPANVIVALDGSVRVMRQLGLDGVGDPATIDQPVAVARIDAARATIRSSRPGARDATTAELTGELRDDYRTAVATLVERPLPTWSNRIALIGDLLALWQQEPDRELRSELASHLRTAIAHAVRGALIRELRDTTRDRADVRLCAIQLFRGLGGPESVAFLLALTVEPISSARRTAARYDPDLLVQLRLIHLCGQLSGELATRAVALPGQESWQVIAPADFLAEIILTERDAYEESLIYSRLRIPALIALSLALGRPTLEFDEGWVKAWYEGRPRL